MAADRTKAHLSPLRGGATQLRRHLAGRGSDAGWWSDLAVAWRAFWISRLVVWAAGLGAMATWGVNAAHRAAFDPQGLTRPFGAFGDALVAPGARWDAVWYLTIARSGYDDGPRTAFFPAYPLLIRPAGFITGSALVGAMLVSCAAFVVALTLVHRLAELELGPDAARWAVLALALFPGALWFSAAYAESVFLAVSVGAVLAARGSRWGLAAALGGVAAATRSAGVLLLVPLVLLWLEAPGRRVRDLAWLALVPAGLAGYCGLLALDGHVATAPFHAQETWHRTLTGPWGGVRDGAVAAWDGLRQLLHGSPTPVYFTRAAGDPMAIARHNLMLFAFLLLAAVLLVGAARRLRAAHVAYAVAALALALSYPVGSQPLMSLPRFLAVLYPLFLWLGAWLADGGPARRNVRAGAVLVPFALALAGFSALSSTWHWVA